MNYFNIKLFYFILLFNLVQFKNLKNKKNSSNSEKSFFSNSSLKYSFQVEETITEPPILLYQDDIEMLNTLVLLRNYMVLDAPSEIDIEINILDKFLDYLVIHLNSVFETTRPIFNQGVKERDLGCDRLPNDVKPLCNVVSSSCLPIDSLVKMIPNNKIKTIDRALVRLCPLFLFKQSNSICEHVEHLTPTQGSQLSEPSVERVWGFSILFVTISIVVSMGGLTFLPFLKRDARKLILTLCEGLAVGGLTGSAVLHLFPQAFSIESKFRIYFWKILFIFVGIYLFYLVERFMQLYNLQKSRNTRRLRRQSLRQDDESALGIKKNTLSTSIQSNSFSTNFKTSYKSSIGYTVKRSTSDHCLNEPYQKQNKLLVVNEKSTSKKKELQKSSSDLKLNTLKISENDEVDQKPSSSITNLGVQQPTNSLMNENLSKLENPIIKLNSECYCHQIDSNLLKKNSFVSFSSNLSNEKSANFQSSSSNLSSFNTSNNLKNINTRRAQSKRHNFFQSEPHLHTLHCKHSYVKDIAGRRRDQVTMVHLPIDSVAWMIVLGDASLNFIDGLSIGTGFERNILAGISISVAVMLEEVTHRLGTFAVLIRAGMKMNQSFLWIFISACAMFPGLVLGIILGDETEYASPYIFAMAGGMFLYMALVDVMREMNRSVELASRKSIRNACKILALQNIGIIVSVFILSILALFEEKLDFVAVEIQEVNNNLIIDNLKSTSKILTNVPDKK